MREVCENSLDHIFKRHYVFQSISRVFHHTQMHAHTCTCTHWGEGGALAFQLIRKRETLVSWVFTLISSDCWGWVNIWVCCVLTASWIGGWGVVRCGRCGRSDDCVRLPRILGWKGIGRCLGYAMLGPLSFLNKTHFEQSAADQISVADQVSQQVVGSHCLNILSRKYCWY